MYMVQSAENLLNWADQNHMQLNITKTKEMILGPLSRSQLPILSTPLGPIDRVSSFTEQGACPVGELAGL